MIQGDHNVNLVMEILIHLKSHKHGTTLPILNYSEDDIIINTETLSEQNFISNVDFLSTVDSDIEEWKITIWKITGNGLKLLKYLKKQYPHVKIQQPQPRPQPQVKKEIGF